MIIKINGIEREPQEDPTAVDVDRWYDRHRKEWVIYPVDKNGYQIGNAQYGFSKAEAIEIENDIRRECGI